MLRNTCRLVEEIALRRHEVGQSLADRHDSQLRYLAFESEVRKQINAAQKLGRQWTSIDVTYLAI